MRPTSYGIDKVNYTNKAATTEWLVSVRYGNRVGLAEASLVDLSATIDHSGAM
jgi:hypothetical protein